MDKQTIAFLCSVYNRYAHGGPVASEETFQFVNKEFLRSSVRKALKSRKLSPEGIKIAKAWLSSSSSSACGAY